MRSVNVNHDAGIGIALGVAIAGNMIAAVEDLDLVTGLSQFTTNDRAGKTSADNCNPVC